MNESMVCTRTMPTTNQSSTRKLLSGNTSPQDKILKLSIIQNNQRVKFNNSVLGTSVKRKPLGFKNHNEDP